MPNKVCDRTAASKDVAVLCLLAILQTYKGGRSNEQGCGRTAAGCYKIYVTNGVVDIMRKNRLLIITLSIICTFFVVLAIVIFLGGLTKSSYSRHIQKVLSMDQTSTYENDPNYGGLVSGIRTGVERDLDDREREIIVDRYGLRGGAPMTQREIAKRYGISRGELLSVKNAIGIDKLINFDSDESLIIKYLRNDDERFEKLFENQQWLNLPIVRNGKEATVGYVPDVWKEWK